MLSSPNLSLARLFEASEEIILMLLIYAKKEQDDLTPEQLKTLKNIVENELK